MRRKDNLNLYSSVVFLFTVLSPGALHAAQPILGEFSAVSSPDFRTDRGVTRLVSAGDQLLAFCGGNDSVYRYVPATHGWRCAGSIALLRRGQVDDFVELNGWVYAYVKSHTPAEAGLFYAHIDLDGSVGEWKRAFYQPIAKLDGSAGVNVYDLMVARGRLYFRAHEYSGSCTFVTTANTDGSPNPWTALSANDILGVSSNGFVYRVGLQTFVAALSVDGLIGEWQATYGPSVAVTGPSLAWKGHIFAACSDGLHHAKPDALGQVDRWERLTGAMDGPLDMVVVGRKLHVLGYSLSSADIVVPGEPDPESLAAAKPATPKVVMDDSKLLFYQYSADKRYLWCWDDIHKRLVRQDRSADLWETVAFKDTEVYWLKLVAGGALLALCPSGLLRSDDCGKSWVPIGALPPIDGRPSDQLYERIAVSDADPAILYLALRSGVYVSSDTGRRWLQRSNGLKMGNDVTCVNVDPSDPRTAYAGVDAVNTRTYIYKTTDSGLHWSPCGQFYNDHEDPSHVTPTSGLPGLRIVNVEVSDTNRFVARGKRASYDSPTSFFVSHDRGKTWVEDENAGH